MTNYTQIKQFWKQKIHHLINRDDMHWTKIGSKYYLKEEAEWESKLDAATKVSEIQEIVLKVGIKTYKVNQKPLSPFSVPYHNLSSFIHYLKIGPEYDQLMKDTFADIEQEITNLTNQLNNYRTKWDGHTCPTCSHNDYDTLKAQIDNLNQQIANLQTERDHLKDQLGGQSDYEKIKQDIIKQIIQESDLGLDNANLEQLINKIKEVMNNPENGERELTDLKQQKEKLQNQITEKDQIIADLQKPNEEIMTELKKKVKDSWQKRGLNNSEWEKSLSEVNTYQQLVDLEEQVSLSSQQEERNNLAKTKQAKRNWQIGTVILLGLVVVGGVVWGYVARKSKKSNKI